MPATTRSLPVFTIATGSRHTSAAGLRVLEQGGNAWDAAIAALAMAFVAEPLLASPGGGGYALSDPASGAPEILDFFAHTPKKRPNDPDTLDFHSIRGDFGGATQEFHIGAAAAATPGAIAGLLAMHRQYASLPLPELLAEAITAARDGIELEPSQRQVAKILTPIVQHNPQTRAIFQPDKNGRVKNPALAKFLDTLAKHGSEAGHEWFYRGEAARIIAATQKNGLIRTDDLAGYSVIRRRPLERKFPGYTLLTNPPPSTGGTLIAEQLSHAHASTLPEPLTLAMAMRHADKIKNRGARNGTTHISVADALGNHVALTVSNGEGNGQIIEPYGFMLNNFLGEEDINPGGFFTWEPNRRMGSMMAPTVLHSACGHRYALGSGGSNRIKTALFQVIWHLTAGKKPLNFAISHPRLHYENDLLDIEAGWPQKAVDTLRESFPSHRLWDNPSLYFGGVHAVQTGHTHSACGDFRRQGCGLTATTKPDRPPQ